MSGRFGPAARFVYAGYELDPAGGRLVVRYELDGQRFAERFTIPAGSAAWSSPAAAEAARLLGLLAGVSYYKAGAPPVVDLGDTPTRPGDNALLGAFYRDGLGEMAYRNGLDLTGLQIVGGRQLDDDPIPWSGGSSGRPLVPFGGGIDSIVTVEELRSRHPQTSLFVVSREGDRFAAIEGAAAVTGLPVVRAERSLDPAILAPRPGWLNGHVPVTGILSAVAVLAAVLGGHDAVVMANEWSASAGNLTLPDGRVVNHQWSKSEAFEELFAVQLGRCLAPPPAYSSYLRSWSELRVARRFAELGAYHRVFRSCNRAFALDPTRRLEHWCGRCDKCCFIDLVLAPFLPATTLAAVFDGHEPLVDPGAEPAFSALLGLSGDRKPWECVGEVGECRAAAALAAARPDRSGTALLQALVSRLPARTAAEADRLLQPLGAGAGTAAGAAAGGPPGGVPSASRGGSAAPPDADDDAARPVVG